MVHGRIFLESDGEGLLSCEIDVVRNVRYVRDIGGKATREFQDGPEREFAKLTVRAGSPVHRELLFALEHKAVLSDIHPGLGWVVVPEKEPQVEPDQKPVVNVLLECVVKGVK